MCLGIGAHSVNNTRCNGNRQDEYRNRPNDSIGLVRGFGKCQNDNGNGKCSRRDNESSKQRSLCADWPVFGNGGDGLMDECCRAQEQTEYVRGVDVLVRYVDATRIICCIEKQISLDPFKEWQAVKAEKDMQKKAALLKPIFDRIDSDKRGTIKRAEFRKFC